MEHVLKIKEKRLMDNLFHLGEIGQNEGGGMDRALGSDSDVAAREWLKTYWKNELGLDTRTDAIANLWITYPGKKQLAPIVIGSHHDAVPDGGKYDGALGVLLATEIIQTLQEQGRQLDHPLMVVSFTGEEPNPYNVSTLGSKVLSGRLTECELATYTNRENGETLKERIRILGGDITKAHQARIQEGELAAFLECHIEQGRRLETRNIPVSAVNCITGIHREQYTVMGEANHAGTTVMTQRRDALLAAAQLALAIEEIAKAYADDDVVATTGYMKVEPNEANIIAGKVTCIADVRTYREKIISDFENKIKKVIRTIAQQRGVSIKREVILRQAHMPMHKTVIAAVQYGIDQVGIEPMSLVSMAGHDAANMARVTKSGMIFVKSINGKSHCKEEYSTPEDIACVGNAMLQAVLALDERG